MAERRSAHTILYKPQKRCLVCSHADEAEISELLWMRSNGVALPNGDKVSGEFLAKYLPATYGISPSAASLFRHLKHLRLLPVETGVASLKGSRQADKVAIREAAEAAGQEEGDVSVEEFLRGVVAAGNARVKATPESVTVDQAVKAAQELGRRKADEGAAALMGVMAQALGASERSRREHPERYTIDGGLKSDYQGGAEVIEAEVVAEIGDGATG